MCRASEKIECTRSHTQHENARCVRRCWHTCSSGRCASYLISHLLSLSLSRARAPFNLSLRRSLSPFPLFPPSLCVCLYATPRRSKASPRTCEHKKEKEKEKKTAGAPRRTESVLIAKDRSPPTSGTSLTSAITLLGGGQEVAFRGWHSEQRAHTVHN